MRILAANVVLAATCAWQLGLGGPDRTTRHTESMRVAR
jgi:hypothetical protein